MPDATLHLGDCLGILPTLPDASVDAIVSDPPYPEISRPYGRMTEAEWFDMMRVVVRETRRILKPTGSAVFILQPNSRKVGSMRPWLFEFQAWCCREWNVVQDAYWWNVCAIATAGATTGGMMKAAIKPCVWLGDSDCLRNQEEVLWGESELTTARRASVRAGRLCHSRPSPGGHHADNRRMFDAAERRGGVVPMNVLPFPNAAPKDSAGAHGHGAGTPEPLADWWTRYISPPGGVVADWFCGSGTMGLAALKRGRSFIGIERDPTYHAIASRRIAEAQSATPLFA